MSTSVQPNATGAYSPADRSNQTPSPGPVNKSTMDFYNLLTTQLTNQNPLEPVSETDFLGQMAQFSTVEQLQGISASVKATQSDTRWLDAQGFLDREVSWRGEGEDAPVQRGIVDAVYRRDGEILLAVDGEEVGLDQIEAVAVGAVAPVPAPVPAPVTVDIL